MLDSKPKNPVLEGEPEPSAPPFEVEDRTGSEAIQALKQALFLRRWVANERARGNLPN